MSENLKAIAKKVFNRSGWDPNPTTETVEQVYDFANDAQDKVLKDAPFLFFEGVARFTTQADEQPTLATDQVALVESDDVPTAGIENPWVFAVVVEVGTTDAIEWETDRSWDGRFIDITDDDGEIHTLQIRSVWSTSTTFTAGGTEYTGEYVFFSVTRPWPHVKYGTGPFDYKVYTPEYFFPDDMVELHSLRIVGRNYPGPITVLSQAEAEAQGIVDHRYDIGGGPPMFAYRRRHFAIPGPNVAPTVAIQDPVQMKGGVLGAWLGPEPPGEFEYCLTYTWGKRDIDYKNPGIGHWSSDGGEWVETAGSVGFSSSTNGFAALNRSREPMWESAPSPVSDAITVSPPTLSAGPTYTAPGGVLVTLPNIEYMQGFMLAGLTTGSVAFDRINNTHSGWHVRIWRRRKSANFTYYTQFGVGMSGQHIPSLHLMDIHDAFYLLAEMRIDQHNEGYFLDIGTVVPDYHRRLRTIHGYQGLRFHPPADARYEIEARMLQRPPRLVSEQDVPPVHPEAIEPIVHYTKHLMHQSLNEPGEAATQLALYEGAIDDLKGRYSDLRPSNQPRRKRMASVRGYTRGRRIPWPRGT